MHREQHRTGIHVWCGESLSVGVASGFIKSGDIVLVTQWLTPPTLSMCFQGVLADGRPIELVAIMSPRELVPLEEYAFKSTS